MASCWTEEKEQRLRELVGRGDLSASQIGRMIGGVSRNAVIGKVSRMGLQLKLRAADGCRMSRGVGCRMPKKRIARPAVAAAGLEVVAPVPPVSLPSAIVEQPKEARGVNAPQPTPRLHPLVTGVADAVVALERDQCKWPLGDMAEAFHFCGNTRFDQAPYCEEHYDRAYNIK